MIDQAAFLISRSYYEVLLLFPQKASIVIKKLKHTHTQLFVVYLQTLAAGVLENLDENASNLALPQGVGVWKCLSPSCERNDTN